jgi:hypothetical protein
MSSLIIVQGKRENTLSEKKKKREHGEQIGSTVSRTGELIVHQH